MPCAMRRVGTQARRDIDDMVSWGIDHLKVDGCYQFDKLHMNGSYAIVGGFLEAVRAPCINLS